MPVKHFFQVGLKVKVKKRSKWLYIELVQAITCTFMHGFQEKITQLFSSRRRSAI